MHTAEEMDFLPSKFAGIVDFSVILEVAILRRAFTKRKTQHYLGIFDLFLNVPSAVQSSLAVLPPAQQSVK